MSAPFFFLTLPVCIAYRRWMHPQFSEEEGGRGKGGGPPKAKKKLRRIPTIVLTGGPCAGKTSALQQMKEGLQELGYTVMVAPEVARLLLEGGVNPGEMRGFQNSILNLQSALEDNLEQLASTLPEGTKVVIITDRGSMDGKCYVSDSDWDEMLEGTRLSAHPSQRAKYLTGNLRDRYDGVCHLVSAADGKPEHYLTDGVRLETHEEAKALDERLRQCYVGHPYLHVVDNSTEFPEKLKRVLDFTKSVLGENPQFIARRRWEVEWNGTYPDQLIVAKNSQTVRYEKGSSESSHTTLVLRSAFASLSESTHGSNTPIYLRFGSTIMGEEKEVMTRDRLTEDEYEKAISENLDLSIPAVEMEVESFVYEKQPFELLKVVEVGGKPPKSPIPMVLSCCYETDKEAQPPPFFKARDVSGQEKKHLFSFLKSN